MEMPTRAQCTKLRSCRIIREQASALLVWLTKLTTIEHDVAHRRMRTKCRNGAKTPKSRRVWILNTEEDVKADTKSANFSGKLSKFESQKLLHPGALYVGDPPTSDRPHRARRAKMHREHSAAAQESKHSVLRMAARQIELGAVLDVERGGRADALACDS